MGGGSRRGVYCQFHLLSQYLGGGGVLIIIILIFFFVKERLFLQ